MGEGIQATVPSNSDIVFFFEGTRFRKNTDPQDQDLQGSNKSAVAFILFDQEALVNLLNNHLI